MSINTTQSNIPNLRFPGFSDEWKEDKVSSIISEYKKKTKNNNEYPVLTSSRKGLILQKDYFKEGNRLSERDNSGFNVIPENFITYRSRSDDGRFFFNQNNTGSIGAISIYYPVFDIISGSNIFIIELLNRDWKKLYKYSVGTSQKVLSITELKKIKIKIPFKLEQQKIASFLSKVDDWIKNLKEQKKYIEIYKKGMMQKIFAQEIRFKDENGKDFEDWEFKKLGELFDYKNGDSFEKNVIENGKYNLITLNSIDINGNLKNKHKTVSFAEWYLQKDDLIMVLSDVAHGNFLGLVDIIPIDNRYVLNQRMGLLRKKNIQINLNFLRTYINRNQRYFKLKGQGSNQQNLSKGDILKFKVNFPCYDEQKKIAEFLTSIDKLLESKQQQIVKAEEWKKGLMQGLFV